MNIQETITSRQNLLKEHSLWTRELPIEVVEEWHNYCQDDEDLSDIEDEIS